jgi:hypothetical protein
MKAQADKKCQERTFEVGDWVYLKLQPYVQVSVAQHASQKLGFKFFGPYEIISKVGKVSYKLKLPETARIHPVIHVSQLKKAVRATNTVSPDLPATLIDETLHIQPELVTGERFIHRGCKEVPQVRVKWTGLPESFETWEPVYAIVNLFPQAPAWGQAGSSGGGTITLQHIPAALKVKRRTDERQRHREAQAQEERKTQDQPAGPIGAQG